MKFNLDSIKIRKHIFSRWGFAFFLVLVLASALIWFLCVRSEDFYSRSISTQGTIIERIDRNSLILGDKCLFPRGKRRLRECHARARQYLVVEFIDHKGQQHRARTRNTIPRSLYSVRQFDPATGLDEYFPPGKYGQDHVAIHYDPQDPAVVTLFGRNLYGESIKWIMWTVFFSFGIFIVLIPTKSNKNH